MKSKMNYQKTNKTAPPIKVILSPTSRQCKKTILQDGVTLNLEGIFYGENRKIEPYTEEFKKNAVKLYKEGNKSYKTLADELGLRSSSQLKSWVKKFDNDESFEDLRGRTSSNTESNPLKGRPKTNFKSIEEERDYYKAQGEYLKKRYPNLHGEG